jgi:hypothetical protein
LARDPVCVVPGGDRPAIQADHVQRHADGGATSAANGIGVCTRHNLAHEHPGHRLQSTPDQERNDIFWITLARKVYQLIHPPALGPGATNTPPNRDDSGDESPDPKARGHDP